LTNSKYFVILTQAIQSCKFQKTQGEKMNIKFIEYFGKKLKKYSKGALELVLIDNGQKALIIRWFLNGKGEKLNCSLVGCITETESSWKIKFTKLYGDRRPMKISYKVHYKQAVKSILG